MTSRRRFIKILAALPPALSFRRSWAASATAPDPSRLALIVGNSAYRDAPLTNPANDAKAVGGLFAQAGFTVDSHLDATRSDMMGAIERFGAAAKRSDTRLVVFYFAGHGAQLDWRNYLLPVDAVVEKQEHMKQRCIDLSLLLGQLSAAKDKTFVIILDACRNNPFGTSYRPEQKGLSQFDAPVGSLLAYATSPGNVASDGEGQNGLYTEHLVRELGKRGTRIEDALKRVRLNVRLASNGAQIPWETTSLESDVFIFNGGQSKLTETEIEKQLEADVLEWTRIKSSKNIDDWINYLRNFPNGRFAEIAQMRLNRLLAEAEKLAAEKRQREEQKAREERQRLERERLEQQRLEQERIERERLRLAEERRLAEEQRLAAERKQLAEQQLKEHRRRLEEQQSRETKRRLEQEKLKLAAPVATVKPDPVQAVAPTPAPPVAAPATASGQIRQPAASAARIPATPMLDIRAGVAMPTLIAPSANPFSAGRYPLNRIFTVGDSATMRISDLLTGIEEHTRTSRVTRVDYDEDRVEYNDGQIVTDLMGNAIKLRQVTFDTPVQWTPAEFQVGRKWTAAFVLSRDGRASSSFYDMQIAGRETIGVPAGSFDTFRIEGTGWNTTQGSRLEVSIWLVPGLNFPIKREQITRGQKGRFRQTERQELVALRQQTFVAA
ncbi:MAG: caspase family protein [Sulfuritalea sp.]|nr:caspase family protein [Sulfuritalea sp.]